MGELCEETPLLLYVLVATACDSIVDRGYEQTIQAWSHDRNKLKRLQKEMTAWRHTSSLGSAIPGEFYFELAIGRNSPGALTMLRQRNSASFSLPRPTNPRKAGEPRGHVVRGMVTLCLQRWIKVREELDKKPTDLQLLHFLKALSKDKSFADLLADMSIPVLSQEAIMKEVSTRRCLRGLVAVLLFRAENGRLPRTLTEAGFHELDPFTDKPLKMVVASGDCRVYSVGPDGTDDKGKKKTFLPDGKSLDRGYDIVASCPVR
jgi:uncharacterized protein YihD (DUF1040 family)